MRPYPFTPALLATAVAAIVASPAFAQDTTKLSEESRAVAADFANRLGAELKKELSAGSPESAIKVCKSVAPDIAAQLSLAHGWRVSRVSLKPRNPMLGTADAWEQNVLASFDERAAKGEDPTKIEYSEIVAEPQGSYFRYMKALPVAPLCTQCHGAGDAVPPNVKVRIAAEYPMDKASGYSVGQIRGAITVKRPLEQ